MWLCMYIKASIVLLSLPYCAVRGVGCMLCVNFARCVHIQMRSNSTSISEQRDTGSILATAIEPHRPHPTTHSSLSLSHSLVFSSNGSVLGLHFSLNQALAAMPGTCSHHDVRRELYSLLEGFPPHTHSNFLLPVSLSLSLSVSLSLSLCISLYLPLPLSLSPSPSPSLSLSLSLSPSLM